MTRGAVLPTSQLPETRQPTPRQLEVLRLLAQGKSYAEVAEDMVITLQSVKNHATNAYQRMGASSAIQAFIRLGWLRPDA